MKLSARNQYRGKLVAVTKGQTTAHVQVQIHRDLPPVMASITNDAVDDLELQVDDEVTVVIKASDVMIGK